MFNRHLLKVIFGFCAVILLGLISLVVLDSMKADDTKSTAIPAIHLEEKESPTAATPTKSPCKKTPQKAC